jgi:hypothetical protein
VECKKYDLKIFATDSSEVTPEELIPVFHRWIQEDELDELMIDVADYSHVHHGPGVILLCHDAQYSLDQADGRAGLRYSRRRETHPGRDDFQTTAERLRSVFRCALSACRRLETEPSLGGRLQFRTDELQLHLNDRLLSPAAPDGWAELAPELESLLADLHYGAPIRLEPETDPAARAGISVKISSSTDLPTLLTRLAEPGL